MTNGELALLKSRISEVMELDQHTSKNGRYLIHSLYFDDYKDISVYTTSSGLTKRFKWRIRYYDEDINYIVLERKEKLNSRCHKKSCRLTLDEYNKIVSGNITDLLYETDKFLIKELTRDILLYNYKPKIIIDYERIAYVQCLNEEGTRILNPIKLSWDENDDYMKPTIVLSEEEFHKKYNMYRRVGSQDYTSISISRI